MTKVNRKDLESLRFALLLMNEFSKQTLNSDTRKKILQHRQRVRKVNILLSTHLAQTEFDLFQLCQAGLPAEHPSSKAIKALCSSDI